jgi:hemoglobin
MLSRPMIAGAAALLLVLGVPGPVPAQTDTETGTETEAQTGTETEAETEDQVEVPTPSGQEAETRVVGGATLYQRLGGYDVIAEVVDDFFRRMGEDERLQRPLEGLSDADMRRVRQHTVDFICEKTGGPCFYTGRDMAAAHEGTGITAADWDRASELMAATLDARGIQNELRDEFGGFIAGLRKDIVEEE